MTTTSATGSKRGFTLIELSIAVFIIAMVMAVALPSFVRSYNTALLSEAARTFSTTCQLARIQAVTQQRPATLHVDLDRQMFWVTQIMKTEEDSAGSEQTLKVYELPKRVTLASAERIDGPSRKDKLVDATFYPNGTCDSITVVFRNGERGAIAATIDPITATAAPYTVK